MHSSMSSQRLFDRPGSWRPDFKTPRSGLDAIISKKKAKSFPQGTFLSQIFIYTSCPFISFPSPLPRANPCPHSSTHPPRARIRSLTPFALFAYPTELADSGPHTLNPHIRITLFRDSPSTYDLRLDLSQIQFKDLKRAVTPYDLAQFATEPPLPFMRLSHSRIPWYIDVEPQNATGVTLYDLFYTMHAYLYQRIKRSDYWNTEMGEEDRAKISASWRERSGRSREEMEQGILKVRSWSISPIVPLRGDCGTEKADLGLLGRVDRFPSTGLYLSRPERTRQGRRLRDENSKDVNDRSVAPPSHARSTTLFIHYIATYSAP